MTGTPLLGSSSCCRFIVSSDVLIQYFDRIPYNGFRQQCHDIGPEKLSCEHVYRNVFCFHPSSDVWSYDRKTVRALQNMRPDNFDSLLTIYSVLLDPESTLLSNNMSDQVVINMLVGVCVCGSFCLCVCLRKQDTSGAAESVDSAGW